MDNIWRIPKPQNNPTALFIINFYRPAPNLSMKNRAIVLFFIEMLTPSIMADFF